MITRAHRADRQPSDRHQSVEVATHLTPWFAGRIATRIWKPALRRRAVDLDFWRVPYDHDLRLATATWAAIAPHGEPPSSYRRRE